MGVRRYGWTDGIEQEWGFIEQVVRTKKKNCMSDMRKNTKKGVVETKKNHT